MSCQTHNRESAFAGAVGFSPATDMVLGEVERQERQRTDLGSLRWFFSGFSKRDTCWATVSISLTRKMNKNHLRFLLPDDLGGVGFTGGKGE